MSTFIPALLRSFGQSWADKKPWSDTNEQMSPNRLGALGLLRSAQVEAGGDVLSLLPYVGLDANIAGGRLVASALARLSDPAVLGDMDAPNSKQVRSAGVMRPNKASLLGAHEPMVSSVLVSKPIANSTQNQTLNAQQGQEGATIPATSAAPVHNDFDIPPPMLVNQAEKPSFWQRRKKVLNDYIQDVPFSASDHQVETGHWYTPLHQGLQTGIDSAVNTAKGLGNLGAMGLNSPALALGMWEGDFEDGADDYQNLLNSTMGVPGLNAAGGVIRGITTSGLATAAKIAGRGRGARLPPVARVANGADRAIPIGPTPSRVGNAGGAEQALAVRFAEAHPARVNEVAAKVNVINRPVAAVPQAVVKPADIAEEEMYRGGYGSDTGEYYAHAVLPGGNGKAIAGHGEYRMGSGDMTIPNGTTLVHPKPGERILNTTGRVIEMIDLDRFAAADAQLRRQMVEQQLDAFQINNPKMRTAVLEQMAELQVSNSGRVIPNITVKTPNKLHVHEASKMVGESTPLSELLKPDAGVCGLATCTEWRR